MAVHSVIFVTPKGCFIEGNIIDPDEYVENPPTTTSVFQRWLNGQSNLVLFKHGDTHYPGVLHLVHCKD